MLRSIVAMALACPSIAWGQGTPTTVLWYSGNGGNAPSSSFQNHIQGSPLFGLVQTSNADISTLDLSIYRFVVLGRPSLPFDSDEIQQMQDFIDNDGLLVIAGESSVGGTNYIDTINALLTGLGKGMQLVDANYQTQDDPNMPGTPLCIAGTVPTGSVFLPQTSPLSTQNLGDIEPGALAQVMAAFTFNDPVQGTVALQGAAFEGRVVLTADGDFFSDSPCGQNARSTLWNGLWTSVCDIDGDGVQSPRCGGFDCDDSNNQVGASFEFYDQDGDGFGDSDLPAPCEPGAVADGSDCDDSDPDINPDADEVCDQVDNDCDSTVDVGVTDSTTWYPDVDGDGFGRNSDAVQACDAPPDHVADNTDCDDARDTTNPDATEVCGNNRDDDCDGQTDENCSTTVPIPTVPPKEGCGCASGAPGGGALTLLVGLVGLTRRRARR